MELSRELSLILYLSLFVITGFLANRLENRCLVRNSTKAVSCQEGLLRCDIPTAGYAFLSILFPCAVLGLRYGIGTDYFSYEHGVELIAEASSFDFGKFGGFSTEVGNYLLAKISMSIFDEYHAYLFFAALVTFGCFFKFFGEYLGTSKYYMMSTICLVYYLGPSMNIIRQTMAVAIYALSLRYVFERKPFKYVVGIAIAMCFHTSVIMYLPTYFLFVERKRSWRRPIYFVLCLLIPMLYSVVVQQLLDTIPIFAKYSLYSARDVAGMDSFGARYGFTLLRIPFICVILFFYKRLAEMDYRNEFMIYLFLIELTTSVLGIYMHWAFRFRYYAMISEIVLIPQLVKLFDKKSRVLVATLIIGYYVLYFCYSHYYHQSDGIFPYAIYLFR